MSDLNSEIEKLLADSRQEVKEFFEDLGQRARNLNMEQGDYQDHTRNLRRSNYYKATEEELILGNSADYASNVESKGYNVIDSGVKLIMEEIR